MPQYYKFESEAHVDPTQTNMQTRSLFRVYSGTLRPFREAVGGI